MSAPTWAKRSVAVAGTMALLSAGFSLPAQAETRIEGPNRYGTSANISATLAKEGGKVIVASGENYPDALAGGGAAASIGAPVLLTRAGSLPDPINDELKRLKPTEIIVLGGDNAVSGAVKGALGDLAKVTPIAGADRYETAALVSKTMFPEGADTVYLASGQNFPDALAAGPAAGVARGPILLTRTGSLPDVTLAELKRLKPTKVVILGGTEAVSAEVGGTVMTTTSTVTRHDGANRHETAIKVSRSTHADGASTVVLADGASYPDALSGAPYAVSKNAPILLTSTNEERNKLVCAEIARLGAKELIVLGGPAAVPQATVDYLDRGCLPEGGVVIEGSRLSTVELPGIWKPAAITLTYKGDDRFLAGVVDAEGNASNLVVLANGPYSGTHLIDSDAIKLHMDTSGDWTAHVKPLTLAQKLEPIRTTGTGDQVLRSAVLTEPFEVVVKAENAAEVTMVVEAYDADGKQIGGMLVNQKGSVNREITIPKGTAIVTVTAHGEWTIEKKA